ncbi:MAG: hypothetical protein ACOX6T_21530 [Myxococcales bacterium]
MCRLARLALAVVGAIALVAGCQPGSSKVESQKPLLGLDGGDEGDGGDLDGDIDDARLDGGDTRPDGAFPADAGGFDTGPDSGVVAGPDAGRPPIGFAFITSFILLAEDIALPSTAVGRKPLAGPTPTIPLERSGFTHPSVLYLPEGWNGYPYWMAASPYYGPVGKDDQFENPHIFRSLDGIHWEEPDGIDNPIDLAPDTPSQSYWSDPHLVLGPEGVLYCFYRGAGPEFGGRSLTFRTSTDGVHWSPRRHAYASGPLASVDYTNKLLSPVVIASGDGWDVFDVVRSSPTALFIPAQKNQTNSFVMRRSSPDIESGYGEYDESQVVGFTNRPWGPHQDPWHLDVRLFAGRWFMLLSTGPIEQSSGEALWLAVSADGSDFTVIEMPLFISGTYRSALVPIDGDERAVRLRVYRSQTSDGTIDVFELVVIF